MKNLDSDREFDEVWCVFDVEWPINHPELGESIELANRGGLKLAISNPCFELWLILHFQDYRKWVDNKEAIALKGKLDSKSRGKDLDFSVYSETISEANDRARELDIWHKGNETNFPNNNPSSGMYLLIESVTGGSKP